MDTTTQTARKGVVRESICCEHRPMKRRVINSVSIGALVCLTLVWLSGEPGGSILGNERNGFFDRLETHWNGEIDFAGQFIPFYHHRTATPVNQLRPHLPSED